MAKKFLYIVAVIIVLVIAGLIILRVWANELTALAFVPTEEFVEQEALAENAYAEPDMWFVRPGEGEELIRWQPEYTNDRGLLPTPAEPSTPDFAVFFVHPTSYLSRSSWNAELGDEEAERVARVYLRGMASPLGKASEIWAPRYRQATIGAFMTDKPEAQMAFDTAYRDVAQAFAHFVDSIDPDLPIVLAGHSQGSLHMMSLLNEQVADTELAERIVAAYVIGWPISETHDLPLMGLPACTAPDQAGCILSWASYAEPADPSQVKAYYSRSIGLNDEPRGNSPVLCTNPLTGTRGGTAPASANLGTLVPETDLTDGTLLSGAIPASCDPRGILLIGDPPDLGRYVLPGNDYHVYDIPLFWANMQVDVARRVSTWTENR
ncbi:DUF3089 domain-containing protein [Altererythrobacter sp.]|uniref:DUF3089 domain-containing protein n=1 Tax=Altererythrobacter sp. TaxID=1872480 RepID=UPI001B2176FF|nr:DUF3089 domain-containing protein [Altererythrobacter sp.]MBO6641027.1 DUF3089 domain-containing protein [Altererythrobacter sp.]MBO6708275.1 DUF3089 domain-containing protein [Altererythrobacter sp.]MBO6945589.1 DUF3089 domain-containing protein [Altererythrobacter sp.]